MKKEIVCLSRNENALVLQSLGIEVFIAVNEEQFKAIIKETLLDLPKIIIIDGYFNQTVLPFKEKYNQDVYPIFLSLPFDLESQNSLNEMEERVKKAIGLDIF